ncbi:MAG TPA: ABC transporter permease subunit, partial [Actinomycetales bacterium]|nr:ABC transporter permease subunit [Actinomycetales bacterium]
MAIFVQALRESWRALLGWAAALVAVLTLYLSFYSSMGTMEGMQAMMDQLPQAMVDAFGFEDIGSGAGWAQSTFFGLLGLFILGAAGISWGARATAGDEESGMLELTLAHRVTRTQVYVQRFLAILVRLALLGAAVTAALLVLDAAVGLELDHANVAPQMLAYLGTGVLSAAVALALGAATGHRGWA